MRVIVGVRRWLVLASVGIAGLAFAGTAIGRWLAAPSPPHVCQDEAMVLGSGARWSCLDSSVLTVQMIPGANVALFRCTCPGHEAPKNGSAP